MRPNVILIAVVVLLVADRSPATVGIAKRLFHSLTQGTF